MNRILVVILAVLVGGCYTQLQIPEQETAYNPVDVQPEPIIIILPQPYPSPQPCPDPHPIPPFHPVIVQPTQQTPTPSAESNRIRSTGATRDENKRTDRGESGGNGRR
jgi:hypothetical protein